MNATPAGHYLEAMAADLRAACKRVAEADAEVRSMAIGLYEQHGNKKLAAGLSITVRKSKTIQYDPAEMRPWVQEHLPHLITVDWAKLEELLGAGDTAKLLDAPAGVYEVEVPVSTWPKTLPCCGLAPPRWPWRKRLPRELIFLTGGPGLSRPPPIKRQRRMAGMSHSRRLTANDWLRIRQVIQPHDTDKGGIMPVKSWTYLVVLDGQEYLATFMVDWPACLVSVMKRPGLGGGHGRGGPSVTRSMTGRRWSACAWPPSGHVRHA